LNFTIDSKGWGDTSLQYIYELLEGVQNCFYEHFESNANVAPFTVAHIDSPNPDDDAMCIRELQLILLNTGDRHWCQFVYQFAHEYCHYQIRKDVVKSMRWFEESICATASIFYLIHLSELWSVNPPNEYWGKHSTDFKDYAVYMLQQHEEFDTDFSHLDSEMLIYLCNYEYDRLKNRYIARKFLPIFEAHPFLWQAVPFLADLTEGLTFAESLKEWAFAAPPICWEGISEIAHVFNVDI